MRPHEWDAARKSACATKRLPEFVREGSDSSRSEGGDAMAHCWNRQSILIGVAGVLEALS